MYRVFQSCVTTAGAHRQACKILMQEPHCKDMFYKPDAYCLIRRSLHESSTERNAIDVSTRLDISASLSSHRPFRPLDYCSNLLTNFNKLNLPNQVLCRTQCPSQPQLDFSPSWQLGNF